MKVSVTYWLRLSGLFLLFTAGLTAQAQTGITIGAVTAPDASAALDIISTTKGVLLPRVALATAIATPATGLIVFQTGGTAGYYYNAGTSGSPSWQQIATVAGAAITAGNGLTKTGQNLALGGSLTQATTVAQGGNLFSLTGGNVGIGTVVPQATLEASGDFRVSNGTTNATLGNSTTGFANFGGSNLGQSFTLPVAATITSVRLFSNNSFTTTFIIYSGAGSGGTALASPQTITFVAGVRTTVNLSSPLALSAGIYSVMVNTGSNGLRYDNNGDTYPGGGIYNGTVSQSASDLDFAIAYTAGSATSSLYVAPGGNVGIGTTGTPGQRLDVTGGSIRIGTSGSGLIFPDGSTQTTAAVTGTGADFIKNGTAQQATSNFNISGNGTVGGTLSAATATVTGTTTTANAVVTTALTGSGSNIGTTVGLGIRADGGLNLGQNTSDNFFVGYLAGRDNTTGVTNYAVGIRAGERTTTGNYNVFLGSAAGQFNTTGGQNLYMGWLAGQVSNGDRNFAIGMQAGRANTASDNHFVGFYAGTATNTGSRNTFEGNYTGVSNTSGGRNTFVGYQAGSANTDGSNNFGFGHMAGPSSGSLTNAGAIGYNARVNQSNSLVLGGTGTDAVKVGIGTITPSQTLDVTGGSIQISTSGQGLIFPDATTQTTAATTSTASNGLTKTGNNIALGGSLSTQTNILQAGSAFTLTGGNVGVGTAVPPATLETNGDFRVSNGTTSTSLGTAGNGNVTASFNGLGQSFTLPTAGTVTSIRLRSNTTHSTTFTIYSGGGTTGAVQATQVISFVADASATVPLTTPLALGAGTYTITLAQPQGLYYFGTGSDAYPGGTLYFGNSAGTGTVDLEFTVNYTSGAATSSLYVATGGNVGIGTSSAPAQKLDVTGGSIKISTVGQGLIFPDATTQTTAATAGSFIQNQTASAQTGGFNVAGTGTVGGTLTTGAGLVVNSGGSNTGTIANGLRFNGPNAGEGIASKTNAGGNQSGLDFYTNSSARLSISNGGNVGIGTTGVPAKRLHVDASNDVLRIDNLAQVSATNNYLVIDGSGNVGKTTVENVSGQVIRLGFNGGDYFENTTTPAAAERGLRFDQHSSAALMSNAPNGAPNFINTITGATLALNQGVAAGNGTRARTTDQVTLPAGVYRVTVRLNGSYFGGNGSPTAFVKFIVNNNEYSFVDALTPAGSGIVTHAEVSDYLNLTATSTVDFALRPLRNFNLIDRLSPNASTDYSYRSLLLIERVR